MTIINPDGMLNITQCPVSVENPTLVIGISSSVGTNMATLKEDFCTGGAFTFSGVSYLNLQDYISRAFENGYDATTLVSCQINFTKTVQSETSNYQATTFTRLNGDVTTSNLITSEEKLKLREHIITTLKTKFGDTGFGVKAFIQDPIKDLGLCSLTDGTYGAAYKDFIANLFNNPYSGYESICNDSYNFSFDTLGNNILSTMNNTYIFSNLTSTDKIVGITITRVGSSFTLSPDQYEVVGNKVIFKEGTLQADDQITLILNDQTSGGW